MAQKQGRSPFQWGCGIMLGVFAAIAFVVIGLPLLGFGICGIGAKMSPYGRYAGPQPTNESATTHASVPAAASEPEPALPPAITLDQYRNTPLHLAARSGDTDAVAELLKSGAVVDARNDRGLTPLHFAAWYGHADVAKLLLSAGADVNAKCGDGRTPLKFAVQEKRYDVGKILRENGGTAE